MKKFIRNNSYLISCILIFIGFFCLPLYTYIYTMNLIDTNVFIFAVNLRYNLIWLFFSLSWILVMFLLIFLVKNKYKLAVYNFLSAVSIFTFVAQIRYCTEMGKYMVFSDVFLAGEGIKYIKSMFMKLDLGMVLVGVFSLICTIVVNILIKKNISINEDIKRKKLVIFLLLIFIASFRLVGYISLGQENRNLSFENKWENNYNAKNIYKDYINPNTSMYVSGLYEYNLRSTYKYFKELFTLDLESIKEEIDVYDSLYSKHTEVNEYSGIFKNKNVIYVLMESIDSWVIDDSTMPTLNRLKNEGLNFTNRYSPFFNGGQTINSEFSMNTGLYAITDYDTIYDIDTVSYDYSLANMLKKNGYKVNSFHANTGKFYNRTMFHKLLGYDNHYSYLDMQKEKKLNKHVNYFIDTNAMSDNSITNKIINKDDKYLSFITTYSAHLEYARSNKIFKALDGNIENIYESEEEYIYRTLANDTDKSLQILLDKLEKKNELDNTVLVLVADHFSYGFNEPEFVAEKKNSPFVDRRYLQNTPFIIWSKDIEHKDIDIIMDTADILPTMLNMLGINYDPNKYMGDDVFSSNHDNFVWFSDGSIISNDEETSKQDMYAKANLNIIKNRNILLSNYYGN